MRVAITGAATGIGAATAAELKQGGAEVVAFDIAEPAADLDAWIRIDMADPTSLAKAADAVAGPFDALLNIAGLIIAIARFTITGP